ncbi:MAG: squalene/phytoene synthase family protein [Halochromatium sp.]
MTDSARAARATPSASAVSAEWRFPNRATPPGSSAYYSVRLAAAAHRDALAALFAWRAELRAILDRISDPGVARIKLDWWRAELERLFAGAPRHPLSEALAPVVVADQLPEQPFVAIIASVETALQNPRYPDLVAQRHADEQDFGALFELLARCEGADDQEQLTTARRTGGWCAQVRRIRDAGRLLRQGREVLTADQLAAAGLSHQQLASAEGRERLPELMRALAGQLYSPPRDSELTPAVRIQLRLHRDLLAVLERSSFDVVDQRIGLTPLRKLWLAWRMSL